MTQTIAPICTCDNSNCPNHHINLRAVDWNDWGKCCEQSFRSMADSTTLWQDVDAAAAFRKVWGLDTEELGGLES